MRTMTLALALLGGLAAGCDHDARLHVGVHPWIGYETLFLARDFGWLPPEVVLHEGATLGDSVAAIESGTVDAAALTLEEMLLARSRGAELTAVLVFDVSAGADVLLARPAYPDIAALRGRRVGIEDSALGPLVLSRALTEAGMSMDDVTLLDLPPDRQVDAWRRGGVDAVVTYGPAAAKLQALGARQVFDSSHMPGAIFDVLAVRRQRLDHPALPGLLAAHFRGLQHLHHSREDAAYRIAARRDQPAAAVGDALAGIHVPDLAQNRRLLAPGGQVLGAALEINTLMVELGLLPAPDDLRRLRDERLVLDLREPAP